MSDTNEAPAEVVKTDIQALIDQDPTFMASVVDYYDAKRVSYLARLDALEALIGFLKSEEQLSVRVAKLEAFMGIKPA